MNVDFFAPSTERDHFPKLEEIRQAGRVVWNDLVKGWMITGYDDVRKVFLNTKNFTTVGGPFAEAFGPEAMLVQADAIHLTIRKVWAKSLMAGAVEAKRPSLARLVEQSVGPIAERLKAGETVNIVESFQDYTTDVIVSQMEMASDWRKDFQRWTRALTDYANVALPGDHPHVIARHKAKAEIYEMLDGEIERRLAMNASEKTPDNPIDLMLAAEATGSITRNITRDNLLNLFIGALDTTVKWMGNSVVTLFRNPGAMVQVSANRPLLPQALEEVMRLETVVQAAPRTVCADGVDIAGVPLAAGDSVYLLLGAANRDPAIFERPTEFDFGRVLRPHYGFGFGVHQCLGVHLARLDTMMFFNRVMDEVPHFEVVSVDYGKSWAAWGPVKLELRSIN